MPRPTPRTILALLAALLLLPGLALAHDPEYTSEMDRDRCTFSPFSNNPHFPLWPGLVLELEGEEEDDEEIVEIFLRISVLSDTEVVDGVRTRVYEEHEEEDGELVEVSRNFLAMCRETGDIWYFGEDVDDYEDGEIVGHEGAWRAGQDGAEAGILFPGSPLIGARFMQEMAPGVAEDRAEILGIEEDLTVPAGTFMGVVHALDSAEDEPDGDDKYYAPGLGIIKDADVELVDFTLPACIPDANTLCLADGRFRVEVDWATEEEEGEGQANQITDDSGEFWFFSPDNVEALVKVLNACDVDPFNSFWVFAAGLTDVEVEITVTDTVSEEMQIYTNDLDTPFQPVLDVSAFETCP